jgi:hypothetical protein
MTEARRFDVVYNQKESDGHDDEDVLTLYYWHLQWHFVPVSLSLGTQAAESTIG